MNEARPYAALSSGLLARKGAAKPAMRPQGINGFEDLGWNDMGHSDEFEEPLPEHVPSSIAALTPAPKLKTGQNGADSADSADGADGADETDEPSVAAQQRAIEDRYDEQTEEDLPDWAEDEHAVRAENDIAAEDEVQAEPVEAEQVQAERVQVAAPAPEAQQRPAAPSQVVALPKRPAVAVGGRKAAFTLRVDAERHLRLRLATAVTGRSAQQIVTQALDEYLASFPEIDALAERVPVTGAKRS